MFTTERLASVGWTSHQGVEEPLQAEYSGHRAIHTDNCESQVALTVHVCDQCSSSRGRVGRNGPV